MTIGEGIRKERIEKGWTAVELSERSGVSAVCIYMCEGGINAPTLYTLIQLASALGTGINELLGYEKAWSEEPPKFDRTRESIDRMLKKNGINCMQLSKKIGVIYNTIYRFRDGTTYPRIKTLISMCDALGCSPDELIAGAEL